MLVQCSDCKKDISAELSACPHCGKPLNTALAKDIKVVRSNFTSCVISSVSQIVMGLILLGAGLYFGGMEDVASEHLTMPKEKIALIQGFVTICYSLGGIMLIFGIWGIVHTYVIIKPALNRLIEAAKHHDAKI
jgi:uncharacterized membrane protein